MSDKMTVTFKIDSDTKEELSKYCEQTGRKMRWVVNRAIGEYLSKELLSDSPALQPNGGREK